MLLMTLLPLAGPLAGQSPPPEEPVPSMVFGEVFDVQLVLVPVTVRRPGGGWIDDLPQSAFRLEVDGRAVPIESFERAGGAVVSLLVLQDLSGSMTHEGKLETSRTALGCLLDRLRPGDEIALATFAGGQTRVEVPFTAEQEPLRESMTVWEGYGTTGLHDAVAWLPDLALEGRSVKRAAVLITDGMDNASGLPPDEARRLVHEAELTVFVLDLGPLRPRPPDDPEVYRFANLLRALAANTGGRYHAVSDPQQVETACAAIVEELRQQYVLGFSVAGTGGERSFEIAVDVDGPRAARRARILHRRGYRGTRPAAWPDGSGGNPGATMSRINRDGRMQ